MNDYSLAIDMMVCNYLKYKARAADKNSASSTRMMYDGLVATREQALIELANKIIMENEKYGIH